MTFAALEQQASAALRRELDRAPQPALEPLLGTIADRYGEGLVAILYYGSCRREDTLEEECLGQEQPWQHFGSGVEKFEHANLHPLVISAPYVNQEC